MTIHPIVFDINILRAALLALTLICDQSVMTLHGYQREST